MERRSSVVTDDPCVVLVVCTGNISRSPFAGLLLADALGPSVRVGCAGTRAVAGRGVDPAMLPYYAEAGVDAGDFVAQQLNVGQVRGADLILTMTNAHRAYVLSLLPAAVQRTFTLREFARLAAVLKPGELTGDTPGVRLRELVELVPQLRERAPWDPDGNDIPDPFGRDRREYDRAVRLMRDALNTIVEAVGGVRGA